MAIESFSSKAVEEFFWTGRIRKRVGWREIAKIAKRKLDMLDYAQKLKDLRAPPGNRLEALKGDLRGFHSIRINDQWRLIFRWTDAGATEVYIDDYH